jgi:hypothetical protein
MGERARAMVVEDHAPARPVDRAGTVVGGSRRRPRTPSGEVSSVTDLLEQMISLRLLSSGPTAPDAGPPGLVELVDRTIAVEPTISKEILRT